MSSVALWPRFALDPLIGEARRRARRRRLLAATVLALLAAGAALVATSGPPATVSPASVGTVSDGILRAALPPGWSDSVGPGFDRTHPEAWVLIGDYRLPPGAARDEGGPRVPAGSVLVTIGDFYADGASRRWATVSSLRMPRALIMSGHWWSVRYAGRALSIQVTFGSGPTPTLVQQVHSLLRGVKRLG